jgi:hypothetical protein
MAVNKAHRLEMAGMGSGRRADFGMPGGQSSIGRESAVARLPEIVNPTIIRSGKGHKW